MSKVIAAEALDTLSEEFARRAQPYTPLDENFDVLKADAATLLRLGLPPRPAQPDAERIWEQVFQAPFQPIRPLDEIRALAMLSVPFGETDEGTLARLSGRMSSSRNWSGAVLLSRDRREFVQVSATWRVPEVMAAPGPRARASSTWIGIDGFSRRRMPSLPQMGTEQRVDENGTASYSLWCQWWLRGKQTIQAPVTLAQVNAGDEVYCIVTRLPDDSPAQGDRNHVSFVARIHTPAADRSTDVTVQHTLAPPVNDDGNPVPCRGAAAEWIMERPREILNGSALGELFELPLFGDVAPQAFAAVPALSVVAKPAALPARDLRAPRLVRMVEQLDDRMRLLVRTEIPKGSRSVRVRRVA